ncbi:hypothetical protein OSB04_011056 [Centaurea solstitialis]|uniref:Uncharacterized protein n=1 Tax=Centaurea solstitialis TaxID=347529 RepID=A0AA38WDC8_9ASTR|nr:hypothetical protein OSB04_011056 [Centaurea solstitialis]
MNRRFNTDKTHATSTPMVGQSVGYKGIYIPSKGNDEEVIEAGIPYLSTIGALFYKQKNKKPRFPGQQLKKGHWYSHCQPVNMISCRSRTLPYEDHPIPATKERSHMAIVEMEISNKGDSLGHGWYIGSIDFHSIIMHNPPNQGTMQNRTDENRVTCIEKIQACKSDDKIDRNGINFQVNSMSLVQDNSSPEHLQPQHAAFISKLWQPLPLLPQAPPASALAVHLLPFQTLFFSTVWTLTLIA